MKDIIISVGLTRHADNCAGTYSGGNKRKLSLGIALVNIDFFGVIDVYFLSFFFLVVWF